MGELITNRRVGKSLSVSTNRSGCHPSLATTARITQRTHTHINFFDLTAVSLDTIYTPDLFLSHSLFDLLDLHSIDHETFPNTPTLFFP